MYNQIHSTYLMKTRYYSKAFLEELNLKKTIVLFVAVMLSLSMFVGCGTKEIPAPSVSLPVQTPAQTPAQTPESTPESAPEQAPIPDETEEPEDSAQTTGLFGDGFFTFTAQDGWYVHETHGQEGDLTYFVRLSDGKPYHEITIEPYKFATVDFLLEGTAKPDGREIIDDVTINGIVYHVVTNNNSLIFLLAPATASDGTENSLMVKVDSFTLEEAMPLLETITIG